MKREEKKNRDGRQNDFEILNHIRKQKAGLVVQLGRTGGAVGMTGGAVGRTGGALGRTNGAVGRTGVAV